MEQTSIVSFFSQRTSGNWLMTLENNRIVVFCSFLCPVSFYVDLIKRVIKTILPSSCSHSNSYRIWERTALSLWERRPPFPNDCSQRPSSPETGTGAELRHKDGPGRAGCCGDKNKWNKGNSVYTGRCNDVGEESTAPLGFLQNTFPVSVCLRQRQTVNHLKGLQVFNLTLTPEVSQTWTTQLDRTRTKTQSKGSQTHY